MSALNKFYKTSRMDIMDDNPSVQNTTTLTVNKPKGMGPRKRSIKLLEHQLLNKLETGWQNSYEPNLGSFSE